LGEYSLMLDWYETIKQCFKCDRYYFTQHAKREMKQEEFGLITFAEVLEALDRFEILSDYPYDKPYPSALIYGITFTGRPLHIVCAYDDDEDRIIVVTLYQPDPHLWVEFRTRK